MEQNIKLVYRVFTAVIKCIYNGLKCIKHFVLQCTNLTASLYHLFSTALSMPFTD